MKPWITRTDNSAWAVMRHVSNFDSLRAGIAAEVVGSNVIAVIELVPLTGLMLLIPAIRGVRVITRLMSLRNPRVQRQSQSSWRPRVRAQLDRGCFVADASRNDILIVSRCWITGTSGRPFEAIAFEDRQRCGRADEAQPGPCGLRVRGVADHGAGMDRGRVVGRRDVDTADRMAILFLEQRLR